MSNSKQVFLDTISSEQANNPSVYSGLITKYKGLNPQEIADSHYATLISKLKSEITTNPLYSSKTPQQIMDLLNSPDVRTITTTQQQVSRLEAISLQVQNNATQVQKYKLSTVNGKVAVSTLDYDALLQKAIDDELVNDPFNRGYGGKTPDQQTALLSASFTSNQTRQEVHGNNYNKVIDQVPYAPNTIQLVDVQEALK